MEAAIIEFQKAGFPLAIKYIRQLAWQYASMNNMKGFSTKSNKAGHKWAKYFAKRHPKILVKKAKNLSSARALCANEINVKNWFKEYEKVLADLNITSPEQIWSGDETGVQNVPKEEFVLAQKQPTKL